MSRDDRIFMVKASAIAIVLSGAFLTALYYAETGPLLDYVKPFIEPVG